MDKLCYGACGEAALELPRSRAFALARRVLFSAPGPDPLPYAAWQSEEGLQIFWECYRYLKAGRAPGAAFNDSVLVAAPKGEEHEDSARE